MMKLIASDFDGTILIDESINKNDIKAIRDFQNVGNLFGLVTGRSCLLYTSDAADDCCRV